ncbi:MAG: radical SAM protein [Deltaproteobacteria bacterium]|nr:radical SAM protein [Deltaproteobacteria bacterium]
MLISEIFYSIQGESTYAGLPCVFIRLAGCNLKCAWCDTPYARAASDGFEMTGDEVLSEAAKYGCRLCEITGGEPLMQSETAETAQRFLDAGYTTLVETNGSAPLTGLDKRVVKIVDVKCPSSGQAGTFLMENLGYITPEDEVKFVISDREDYEFAKRFLGEVLRDSTQNILFAPVTPGLNPKKLAQWILKDGLPVRLQLQLHKYIWGNERGR